MDDYTVTSRSRSGNLRPVLLAVGGSFLLGGAVVGYAVYKYNQGDAGQADSAPAQQVAGDIDSAGPADPTPSPRATASEAAAQQAVERVAEQQGGIDQRLAAAEQRLSRLDLQAQAAAGNAARAEGLLIAFATRRAIDKGAELGFLADQLRLRFGDALPNAVRTIIQSSRDPVTLDALIAQLDGLSPRLAETGDRPAFERLGEELSQLFVIRRSSAPSPQPERRLERAKLFLETGRPDAAIDEVRNMPGADRAANWLRNAERYAATQRALDLIETSAVLEPRLLRDGAGVRIEQASPAEE